jgi:hypothetical protein
MTSLPDDFLPHLQALLTRWGEQAQTAARKINTSREPTAGAYYSGVRFGYEDSADDLARLLSEALVQATNTAEQ